jgi:hypothetical protein
MDDANLTKLTVSHKGMRPEFSKDIVSYEIDVPCSLDVIHVKATPSDTGASFVVKNETNKTFGSDVKLVDGDNKIVVEVTSEDGTIKNYSIKCKRLSASDANLNQLEFVTENLELRPAFDPHELQYLGLAGFKLTEAKFKIDVLDPACTLEVSSGKTVIKTGEDSAYTLGL